MDAVDRYGNCQFWTGYDEPFEHPSRCSAAVRLSVVRDVFSIVLFGLLMLRPLVHCTCSVCTLHPSVIFAAMFFV